MTLVEKLCMTIELSGLEVTPRFLRHANESRLRSLVDEIGHFRKELDNFPKGSRITFTTAEISGSEDEWNTRRFIIDASVVDLQGGIHTHQLVLDSGANFAESLRERLLYLKSLSHSS